jgi:protein involved in polysaccharide export with SLBB domain
VLQPFDQVYVRKSPGYQTQITVKVEGEVMYPGHYALKKKDERISDLINRSGGITNEGFIEGATLIRRTEFNPPASDEKMRLENLKNLQNNLEAEKENSQLVEAESEYLQQKRLHNIDKQLKQYKEDEDAEIGREGIRVKRQRMNELLQKENHGRKMDNLTYETIGIQMEKILTNPGSKYDLILQDGDILSIPRQLETVRLRGEFLYPITVRYDQQLSFKNYVSMAGGFTEDARKKKSYVIYANGTVDRTKKFLFWNNYPKVATGAEIVVPRRPEKKKLSPTEMIAIMSGLTSITLAIMTFANK